jgi:hypothetical protein
MPVTKKWQMIRHAEGSDYGEGSYTLLPQGVTIKEGLTEEDAAMIEVAPEALSVLREFYRDVKAVGARQTKEEWPHIYETWRRARAVLSRLGKRTPEL